MLLIKYSAAQAFTKAFYRPTHGWQGIRRPASENQAPMALCLEVGELLVGRRTLGNSYLGNLKIFVVLSFADLFFTLWVTS
jgi:hypothetical protein